MANLLKTSNLKSGPSKYDLHWINFLARSTQKLTLLNSNDTLSLKNIRREKYQIIIIFVMIKKLKQ